MKFLFSGQKKIGNFRTFFRTSESQKTRFSVILSAYNFGTYRAEAKITIRRHEVVYRLSSEHKMIDLE